MRDIKTKLIKLLPNNEEFDLINHEESHHDILTFNGNEYIVWYITREGLIFGLKWKIVRLSVSQCAVDIIAILKMYRLFSIRLFLNE